MDENKSPFTRYREGYVDGYEGEPVQLPCDADYLRGYINGTEDDMMGMASQYPTEEAEEAPTPVLASAILPGL